MSVRLSLKVIPGAAQTVVVGWLGNDLKIRVNAPPEKGKANKSVIQLLASTFKTNARSISIIKGQTSSHKIIEITGISQAQLDRTIAQINQ